MSSLVKAGDDVKMLKVTAAFERMQRAAARRKVD
jgi:hypothetical protein